MKNKSQIFLATHGYINGLVDYRHCDGSNYTVKLNIVLDEYLKFIENKL